MTEYRVVAKKLGVHYLFGRWGVSFCSRMPEGKRIWHIRLTPLDGWSFDPKEIENAIRLDDDFVVTASQPANKNGDE